MREDRAAVLASIDTECTKQEDKVYTSAHDDDHASHDWVAIFIRELGGATFCDSRATFRAALVKVAAVAVNGILWADRQGA